MAYSDRFVEELMKAVQNLASENKELMDDLKEYKQKANSLRYQPLINLAQSIPPYPKDGTVQEKKEWKEYYKELLRQVNFEDK